MNDYPGTKKQIIDISWRYDIKTESYSQTLTLYDHKENEKQVIMLRDYEFNWHLTGDRYCPGFSDKDGYKPCPNNTILYKDSYQLCFECEQKLGFKATFFFGAEPNEFMKEYLSKKHYIYLAFFAPNILKVGTAAHSRRFIRPIEQDALIYSYIAESDGFKIQDFEHTISRRVGITEAVSSSTKFKNMQLKPDIKYATKKINSYFNNIKASFNSSEFKDWIFEENEIIDLSKTKDLFYPAVKVNRVPKDELTNIFGNFKGLRGRFTIIENGGVLVAFDERKIIGRFIDDYLDKYTYSIKSAVSSDQLSMI